MTARTDTALLNVLRRDGLIVAAALAFVTISAWGYLIWLAQTVPLRGMAMMPAFAPWSPTHGLFVFAMWAVMMVGMMTGTAAPMLLLFAGAHAARGTRGMPPAVMTFGLGY